MKTMQRARIKDHVLRGNMSQEEAQAQYKKGRTPDTYFGVMVEQDEIEG